MKRFTRLVARVGLRAALGRAASRMRAEITGRFEAAMVAASFRRAGGTRVRSAPVFLRAHREPIFSIVVSPSGCSVAELASTLRSIERETSEPYEVLILERGAEPEVLRYTKRCRGLLDVSAVAPRGRFHLHVDAGVTLTRHWDRRLLQTFDLHPSARRVACALRLRDGACADGLQTNYICPIEAVESPCVAVCVSPGADVMLYDPYAVAVVPKRLVQSYEMMPRPAILVMDSFVPRTDRDAGSRRMLAILELLHDLGYRVIFVPQGGGEQRAETAKLRARGIDVRVHDGDAMQAIASISAAVAAAWLSRPEIMAQFSPFIRERFDAPIIYDTVDLHHLRLEREELVCATPTNWREIRDLELSLARDAAVTVVTSVHEQRVLADAGVGAQVLSVVEEPVTNIPPVGGRHGLLFVGNFTHAPNRDAVTVLVREVLPLLRNRSGVHLTIAGFDPTGWTRRYAGRGVSVLGHVADLEPLLQTARVFVAPLRFGAGAKGKIVQSLAHGLPVVTTPIGAEGLELRDDIDVVVRDLGPRFAQAVATLMSDDARWNEMSQAARRSAERFSPSAARDALAAILERVRAVPPARA